MGSAADFLDCYANDGLWDVILTQEWVSGLTELGSSSHDGHKIFSFPGTEADARGYGICIHRDLALSAGNPVSFFRGGEVELSLSGRRWRLLTSHLPHEGRGEEEFNLALEALESSVERSLASGARVVCSVDANCSIGVCANEYENDSLGPRGPELR